MTAHLPPLAPSTAPDPGKAARWYVERLGWVVLPVHYPTDRRCSCGNPACTRVAKHPALPTGVYGATRDIEAIAGWWARPWNVAIATGALSRLWVLDVDGAEGMASMARAELEHGRLPQTVTAQTGGGGLHLLWQLPKERVANRVGLLPGVDVRGEGGYIVVPPSRHVSGQRYTWHDGRGPHQVAVAEAPPWLLTVANCRINGRGERHDWPALFRTRVPEGERNHALAQRAGYLLQLGVDREVATELLVAWSHGHCTPALPDREVRRTVQSIAQRESRRRRTAS
ncbi:bifunctional DNA primase/polymerase [Myxococcota bacterium]